MKDPMGQPNAARWLIGPIEERTPSPTLRLHDDPRTFLRTNTSEQAAMCRQVWEMEPLPSDGESLDRLASDLVTHIEKRREPSNDAFQKGYAELLLRQNHALQDATIQLIQEQWKTEKGIGHYELLSALILEYSAGEPIRKTLAEIYNNLKTWDNKGWCPWTPALWMRILWLGRDLSDASADIAAQLQYIDAHLTEDGQFQDREPFCLMYCIGLQDQPIGDKMLDRFLRVIVDKQRPDGGWGDYSYIVFTLLRKWDLMDAVAP